jgi:hypothetical protein
MRRLVVLATVVMVTTVMLVVSISSALALERFPKMGKPMPTTEPCATPAEESGAPKFEDRGGGVCWLSPPAKGIKSS